MFAIHVHRLAGCGNGRPLCISTPVPHSIQALWFGVVVLVVDQHLRVAEGVVDAFSSGGRYQEDLSHVDRSTVV